MENTTIELPLIPFRQRRPLLLLLLFLLRERPHWALGGVRLRLGPGGVPEGRGVLQPGYNFKKYRMKLRDKVRNIWPIGISQEKSSIARILRKWSTSHAQCDAQIPYVHVSEHTLWLAKNEFFSAQEITPRRRASSKRGHNAGIFLEFRYLQH